jgi:hypothetical protein
MLTLCPACCRWCAKQDEIGERLMRFLVLVAAWDKNLLAENLFSAIGVRVVDMLHSADILDDPAEGDTARGNNRVVEI